MTTDNAAGRHEVGYAYDNLDRVVSRTVDGSDPTSYSYDKASRPITLTYRNQTTTYVWDNASRLTSKTLPDGIVQNFTYDDANRITQIQYLKPNATVIETIAYTYDANGQRLTKTTGGSGAQETTIAATYDAANRMTSLTLTATGQSFTLAYDDNGNLATKTDAANPGNVTTYTWDSRNRLTAINAPGITATFQYDALGRRAAKTVNGQTVGYVYDGMQAMGEVSGGAISTTILTTLAIDDVVARYTQAGARTYLTDAVGSVLALAKDDQSIQAFYAYTPYGEATTLGDDEGNPIQYTARENDQTGLYFYRARYYDPVLKQFISEDPIGMAGGANFRRFVSGNPIRYTDPYGLLIFSAIGQATRFITGQTAQEAYVGGQIADAIAGPVLEGGGQGLIPSSVTERYGALIDAAQVAMSVQGISLSVNVAIGMAGTGATVTGAAASAGAAAVALPAIIAGVSGYTVGSGLNRLYERLMGQSLGSAWYDLLNCR